MTTQNTDTCASIWRILLVICNVWLQQCNIWYEKIWYHKNFEIHHESMVVMWHIWLEFWNDHGYTSEAKHDTKSSLHACMKNNLILDWFFKAVLVILHLWFTQWFVTIRHLCLLQWWYDAFDDNAIFDISLVIMIPAMSYNVKIGQIMKIEFIFWWHIHVSERRVKFILWFMIVKMLEII